MTGDDSPQVMKQFVVHAATIMVIVPALVILNGLYQDYKRLRRWVSRVR